MASIAARTRAAARSPAGTPVDVGLMNGVALVVLVAAAGVLLAAIVWWLMRSPWWTIRTLEVQGDLQRNSPASLRASALPRLHGTFLTLDLARAQAVFESIPWVRKAVVRRVWPNRLSVTLEEHRPAARWFATDGSERLVNSHGEVFDGMLDDLEGEALPTLSGPDGTSARLLQMHRSVDPQFRRLSRRVLHVELSSRGSWGLVLDDDASIQLGRGDDAEVLARTTRFTSTVSQVTGNYRAALVSADLRHSSGYAIRLRGLQTVDVPPGPGGRN